MGNICCEHKEPKFSGAARTKVNKSNEPRRSTLAPNMKNFKNLKWVADIKTQYEMGGLLGEGSFGRVNKAMHVKTGKEFAVKTIKKKMIQTNKVLDTLMISELSILQKCSHPNIMRVIELLEDNYHYYIVTELLEGGELFDRIINEGSFSEKKAVKIVKQVLLALNYMHRQKMIHRDLKP
jgi:calcium-dependent protein kinase